MGKPIVGSSSRSNSSSSSSSSSSWSSRWWNVGSMGSSSRSSSRSRWWSVEFMFYYAYAAYFYYLFLTHSISLSTQFAKLPPFRSHMRGLHPGWVLNREVDLTDHQWRTFRSSLPLLTAAMLSLCGTARLLLPPLTNLLNSLLLPTLTKPLNLLLLPSLTRFHHLLPSSLIRTLHLTPLQGLHRVTLREVTLREVTLYYWLVTSLAYVTFLHGFGAVHVAVLVGANYLLVKRLKGSRAFLGILWAFHCGTFMLVRAYDGFPFSMLAPVVPPSWGPVLLYMDSHRGMLRWHISYNLLMLRMLSYACDLHWSYLPLSNPPQPPTPPHTLPQPPILTPPHTLPQPPILTPSHTLPQSSILTPPHTLPQSTTNSTLEALSQSTNQNIPHNLSQSTNQSIPHTFPQFTNQATTHTLPESAPQTIAADISNMSIGSDEEEQGATPLLGAKQNDSSTVLPIKTLNMPLPIKPSSTVLPIRPSSIALPIRASKGSSPKGIIPDPDAASSPVLYTVYLFFPPLYVAGPIIPFYSFSAQLSSLGDAPAPSDASGKRGGSEPVVSAPSDSPAASYPTRGYASGTPATAPRALLLYGLRALLPLVLLECMLHWCYFPALASTRLWRYMSTAQLCALSYGTLTFVWLKFLTIWRISRFWSLVAGIDPPENILRCLSNNYSVQGFWRRWHASYNRWIVRYLYVPLGGSNRKLLNAFVVFTFVALWHDLEWKMLYWAWLMTLLFLPEIFLSWAASKPPLKEMQGTVFVRESTAVLGAFNIMALMLANLIGFVVGPSGASDILTRLVAPESHGVILYVIVSLYIGVKFMLEIREGERRQKCNKLGKMC